MNSLPPPSSPSSSSSGDQSFRSILGDLAFLGLIGYLARTHAISESPIVMLLGVYASGRFGIKMHREAMQAITGGSGASGKYPAQRPPDGPPPTSGTSGERRFPGAVPGESPAVRPGSYRGPGDVRRWVLEWAPTLGAIAVALYMLAQNAVETVDPAEAAGSSESSAVVGGPP